MPADQVAKIIDVDTSKINRSNADFTKREAAEVSFIAQIEHGGVTYNRKFTFVVHDELIHHIGGPVTQADVETAILAEVGKIKPMHAVAAALNAKKNVDLVAEVKAKGPKK